MISSRLQQCMSVTENMRQNREPTCKYPFREIIILKFQRKRNQIDLWICSNFNLDPSRNGVAITMKRILNNFHVHYLSLLSNVLKFTFYFYTYFLVLCTKHSKVASHLAKVIAS